MKYTVWGHLSFRMIESRWCKKYFSSNVHNIERPITGKNTFFKVVHIFSYTITYSFYCIVWFVKKKYVQIYKKNMILKIQVLRKNVSLSRIEFVKSTQKSSIISEIFDKICPLTLRVIFTPSTIDDRKKKKKILVEYFFENYIYAKFYQNSRSLGSGFYHSTTQRRYIQRN